MNACVWFYEAHEFSYCFSRNKIPAVCLTEMSYFRLRYSAVLHETWPLTIGFLCIDLYKPFIMAYFLCIPPILNGAKITEYCTSAFVIVANSYFFSILFPCLFFGIHVDIAFCCKKDLLSRAMTIWSFY